MLRYSLFLALVFGGAATAIASIAPQADPTPVKNLTIIEKNLDYPFVGPLVVETCQVADCSDVQG